MNADTTLILELIKAAAPFADLLEYDYDENTSFDLTIESDDVKRLKKALEALNASLSKEA